MPDNTSSFHFKQLAEQFRRIEADNHVDGFLYCKEVGASAAQEVRRSRLLDDTKGQFIWPDMNVPHSTLTDVQLWFSAWQMILVVLVNILPDQFDSFVALPREKIIPTTESGRFFQGTLEPRDWRRRADQYAMVCDLLAELVGSDAKFDEPTTNSDRDKEQTEEQQKPPQRKLGRPPDTDRERADAEIAAKWKAGKYHIHAKLDSELNLPTGTVHDAIERHRKLKSRRTN